MIVYDALVLAVAAATFCAPGKRWWVAACTPILVFATGAMLDHANQQQYQAPVAALLACVIARRYAPAALLLALPSYASLAESAFAAAMWPIALTLIRSLETRFTDATVPARLRGAPIRLIACAILYYALIPMAYIYS